MSQQIKKKFLSPEIIDYFEDQIEAVSGNLAQESLDRISGDENSVSLSNSYTDSKVLEEKDLREAADLVLEGRITSLEDQVGEDLQQAISDLESDLAVEALARSNADNVLQEQIDVLKTFGLDQIVHVAKNGVDTNNGKQHSPFLTITAALNSITDASPEKRFAIKVAPGTYVEANIALKANVFVVGEGAKEAVRIDSTISMDSSFSGSGDHRSGFANVVILKAASFDWSSVTSAAGKLYFSQVVFVSTVNMYGHNNATAQSQFADCQIFGKLTISGINVGVFHNNFCWAGIELNQHPNGGMATILNAVGGTINGELKLTTTVDDFNRRCSAFVKSCYASQITIDGIKSYVDATNDSIPAAGATIVNGGNLVRLNVEGLRKDLSNLSYPTAVNQPIMPAITGTTNLGDWGKQWAWNFGYVHASTGTDLYLISYPESYAPDSSGKSIGIYTDGAGLQENVDGGSIKLATPLTSGTGVRGKITLDAKEIDVTSKQIKNLADGTSLTDAVNKGQLDSAISSIPEVDLSSYYTKSEVDSTVQTEKERIDAILLASDADKDSFAEIVALINSVDTENDQVFSGYVTSNNVRVDALEAKGFSKGSTVVGSELSFIDLDRQYETILSVSIGRLSVHEGEDFTVSAVGGKTRITWIGSLVNPDGAEAIETGDKVFWSGAY
jgi:hypothetical protein